MNRRNVLLLLLTGLFLWETAAAADNNDMLQVHHQEPTLIERHAAVGLTFKVPGIDANEVQEAYIFYRVDGEIAYRQKKAALLSSSFKVQLSIDDRQATELEYYFEVQLNNGDRLTYPRASASRDPIQVVVVEPRKTEREKRVAQTGVDYTILSPEAGATVSQNDVVVALTLFYDPAEIDTANTSFQLLLDGEDVTDRANASDYFYTYPVDNLPAGEHTATFNLQKPDTTLEVTSWQFTVLDPDRVTTSASRQQTESWMPSGQLQVTARSQQVGNIPNDALSGNVRISGEKGNVSYAAYGLLTSQEDPRLQPQNRFGANVYVGDWLALEAGHVYPNLSTLTIAGQRMQGLNAELHVWDSALNLQFVYGKLRRGIDNLYRPVQAEYQEFGGSRVDTTYQLSVGRGEDGTFERDIVGGRLGVGRGESFEFGLNFLKVEDDTGSITYINDFNTLMDRKPQLISNLESDERSDLTANPDQLSIEGNPRPKGNFVAASDLEMSFDSDRIRLQADGALSLLNEDISEGVLTRETADDLGLSIDRGTEDMLEQLSWLIIINENMNTLPIRFNTEGTDTSGEAFFPTGILAGQSQLGLNYFDNNVKLRYRWVGPNYRSLANTTIRNDIAGFDISDRLQLFQDRIYLTLGYEHLQDNVINNKSATTNTNTYRGNVSWYPLDQGLPRLSLGIMSRNRDNDVSLYNPFVSSDRENAAVRNFTIQEGDTLGAPNARLTNSLQFTSSVSQEFSAFDIEHEASLSYSLITTQDERFRYGDTQSNSLSMGVVSRFQEQPLQTTFGFNVNNTETAGGLTDIRIIGVRLGGSLFLLDDKLNVNASLAFTKNRSESTALEVSDNNSQQESNDDYYVPGSTTVSESNSYIINAGGRYNLSSRHSFVVTIRYSNVRNVLVGTRGIPNDHLMQARYIFNF